jgi:hypothetical protein
VNLDPSNLVWRQPAKDTIRILLRPTPAERLRIPNLCLLSLAMFVPMLLLARGALPRGMHMSQGFNFSYGLVLGASIGLYKWPLRQVAWRMATAYAVGAVSVIALAWMMPR